ncbi:sporulation integral membrane protein YtvI [Virgibacillus natechei]|uniref:Sporulation integral membrane protein YtvI n=1 Tax=Virgibacillus natechei TaxID=1216297 RepID=A0ABS4IBM7_9BACI|nr:sporulation integral membrane protein YtvI [Virgibacillus natechei]MBP1968335.1 sporulation integral membrane protein YtvI [Virgibacillus natechei]UZD13469.1 sporulation integral membrane protein YtvI [Virgibacillus natechei]
MNHPIIQMIFRILLILLLTVIGLFLLFHFLRLTYPFLIAAMFAFLINPIIRLLEKHAHFPRPIAVLTSILLLIGIVGGFVTILVKKTIDGIHYLSDYIPSQIEQISSNVQSYFNQYIFPLWDQGIGLLDNIEPSQRQALQEGIQIIGSNVAATLGNFGQGIANGISAFVGALPITFTVIIFSMLAVYFISKDSKGYAAMYKDKLPLTFRKKTMHVLLDLKVKVFGFLKSQIILMTLTAIISLIGLLILQVDQAITIAVILGIIDLIPYFGPGLILIPWSIYSFFTGDIFLGFGLLILYASTVTARQIAEPKVLSSSLKLNPLAILVSLFAGLQLFGLIGLVIGPIILVLFISLYDANVFNGLWRFIKGDSVGQRDS